MKIRRFCSGLLAAVLLLGLMVLPAGAAAASTVSTEEAIQVINALGIMVGDESGEFHLNRRVTRAEFITMAVNATGTGDQVGEASTSPYPDVPRTHWAAGYVQAGVQAGLISGYLDGTFRLSNQITLAEGATIVLKLLGYTAEDFSGAYPTGQLAMYRNLKLDRGVTAQKSTDVLTRQDTLYLFYNLLSTNTKEGTPYINKLGYSLNAAGEVDRVALVNGVMEGPVVAAGSWQQSVPFDVDSARVYRDGAASSAKSIQNNDIVYWSESMQTLWVYTDRVAGTIQELSPTPSNPTSVKVAGQTYEIETASAAYELSDLGSYQVGDTVTLLLGRNGGVAAVAAASASQDGSKIGIVTNLSRGTYSGSGANSSYTADTVTILATDGRTYSYQWTTDYFKLGNLVQVVISSEDGSVSLKRLSETGKLSGKVSSDASKLGSYPFADGVEILDTYEGTGVRIYPERLAGLNVTTDMVRYYTLNGAGEITKLILKDATGDMHSYGIMTDVVDSSPEGGVSVIVSYTMDLAGEIVSLPGLSVKYGVKKGPVVVMGNVQAPDKIRQLTEVEAARVSGNTVTAGNRTYLMSDNVLVYEYRGGDYYLSSLDRVKDGGYELSAWYDRSEKDGGRIRVIVAK